MGLYCTLLGTEIQPEEEELLKHPLVQGIIYFKKNIQSVKQLKKLSRDIKKINPLIDLAIDHEGGKVNRFEHLHYRQLTAKIYGNLFENQKDLARKTLRIELSPLLKELQECQIGTIFGPCLDVDQGNAVISSYDRSFSKDLKIIEEASCAIITLYEEFNLRAVIKHFPCHGGSYGDSHYQFTYDLRTREELAPSIALYKRLLKDFPKTCLMMSHVIYPHIDQKPVTFSNKWHSILTEEVKISLKDIFTDCLAMRGIAPHYIREYKKLIQSCRTIWCHQTPHTYLELLNSSEQPPELKKIHVNKGVI